MTERLTKKGDGFCYTTHDVKECVCYDENGKNAFSIYEGKAVDKLAHYEDLEEQGRLVVLSEGYDKECLCDALRTWEKALKGGAEDVSRGNDGEATKA